jgi:hypothetical protein
VTHEIDEVRGEGRVAQRPQGDIVSGTDRATVANGEMGGKRVAIVPSAVIHLRFAPGVETL